MSYTIGILEDVQGKITVNFDKNGNKYLIGIYHKETKEYTHNTFATHSEAYAVFEKLTRAILKGEYSYEQRKEMIIQ
jgi:hypothetical protein